MTRRTIVGKNPNGWIPEQQITVEEALRSYTVNNAYAMFRENEIGKIAPGMLADMVVSPMTSPNLGGLSPAKVLVESKGGVLPDSTTAGMSNAAVKKATGRDWSEGVKVLDAVKAAAKNHREIAQYVSSIGTPDWWSQMVTVGYERIRDCAIADSAAMVATKRTKAARSRRRYRSFSTRLRSRASARAGCPARSRFEERHRTSGCACAWKMTRFSRSTSSPKGDAKSAVAVQHSKLADKPTAEKMKSWWGERFDALAEVSG